MAEHILSAQHQRSAITEADAIVVTCERVVDGRIVAIVWQHVFTPAEADALVRAVEVARSECGP